MNKETIDYLRSRSRRVAQREVKGVGVGTSIGKSTNKLEGLPLTPCKYLGDPNGELVDCPTCPGMSKNGERVKTRVKTFSCNIYGMCTIAKPVGTTRCCANCISYVPADKVEVEKIGVDKVERGIPLPITTIPNNPSLLSERKSIPTGISGVSGVSNANGIENSSVIPTGITSIPGISGIQGLVTPTIPAVPQPVEPILPPAMQKEKEKVIPYPSEHTKRIHWAYGITTTSPRFYTTLPTTIIELAKGGFDNPTIFADDCSLQQALELEQRTKLPVVPRRRHHPDQPGIAWSNYLLALYDLCIRNRNATRVVIFQDDISCPHNLKHYLSLLPYPTKGYWNLYTGDQNETLAGNYSHTGWFKSNQLGRGALALVFDRETVESLLGSIITSRRPRNAKIEWVKNIDGWVQDVLVANQGYTEWCHKPGLVQHRGVGISTVGSLQIRAPKCYLGDEKDCMELLKKEE